MRWRGHWQPARRWDNGWDCATNFRHHTAQRYRGGASRQGVQIVQYRGTENLHAQHLFNLVKCTFNMSCFSSFCCNMVTGTVDSVISMLEEAYLPPFKIHCVMREGYVQYLYQDLVVGAEQLIERKSDTSFCKIHTAVNSKLDWCLLKASCSLRVSNHGQVNCLRQLHHRPGWFQQTVTQGSLLFSKN